ncbi:MAG: hypothetical protein Q7R49_00120 [Candidatus Daviesbacteria bacterium]|nr:hypothetical protein [Candidatus Daviesbacteria bacterium]
MAGGAERETKYIEPRHVTFADEKTRRKMEIMQQIQFLAATLPPIPIPEKGYDLTPISFKEELQNDGATALFHLGDSSQEETYEIDGKKLEVNFVKPRTIQILDALRLPYVNHTAVKPSQE